MNSSVELPGSSLANYQISKLAHSLVRPLFAAALALMVIVSMISQGIYDTGDGILHYQMARWSWQHPELLLDHWGKPVFTLVASPFAQFGYKGVVLFNVLCHIGSAWLTWRIADRMKLPFAFLAGPLLIFAPVSWGVAQSGLTEPLFALTLMLAIYFITGGRYSTAAIIISLLPFVRTEGFLLAPLFGIYFIARKEFLPLALLASGTIVYSVLGGIFVHNDFLWVMHQNPYRGEELYGHGTLFHFVDRNEFIFGWAMTGLIAIGLITVPFRRQFTPRHSLAEFLLVFGAFVVFFAAHSIFWWKGLFGSLGLLRVMACVMPCAVIISLRGLQLLSLPFAARKYPAMILACIALVLTMFNTLRYHHLILEPDEKQIAAEETAAKIKELGLESRLMYYAHPVITHLLDKDPFDPAQSRQYHELKNEFAPRGSIIIWDSHFWPKTSGHQDTELIVKGSAPAVFSVYDKKDSTLLWSVYTHQYCGEPPH